VSDRPTGVIVVLCTAPDAEIAARIANGLVSESLAACVNLVKGVESIYRWEGRLQHDSEVLMVIKSTHAAFGSLRDKISELHPYDTPEIIALPVVEVAESYFEWVRGSVMIGDQEESDKGGS